MSGGWLTRPAREQPLVVAVLGLLLAAAIALTILLASPHHTTRSPSVPAPRSTAPPAVIGTRAPPPLTAGQLALARRTAGRFLASYLPVLYGRASAHTIRDTDPHVRAELIAAGRTPRAPDNRRPRVTSLAAHSQTSSTVVFIAVVTDGIQPPYQIVFQLTEQRHRWRVTQLANY